MTLPKPNNPEISPETRAIVEQNIPNASDEVKRRVGELMEAARQQRLRRSSLHSYTTPT